MIYSKSLFNERLNGELEPDFKLTILRHHEHDPKALQNMYQYVN